MFCPHCGAENEESNRYCVGCGSDLPSSSGKPKVPAAPTSWPQQVGKIFGTTRRARLLSACTAAAILIAVIAFLALEPASEGPGSDAFTRSLDRTCVKEKQTIAALERQTAEQHPVDFATFAGALVTIVEEWRGSLEQSPPPPIHAEAVQALDAALLDVLIKAGTLARVAQTGNRAQVAVSALAVDKASAQVEPAIESLALSRCADLDIGLQPGTSR